MKDKLKTFGYLLIGIPLLPLFLLFILLASLFVLCASPFRRAKYKKSHFYRDFGEKYNFNFYGSETYTIYNAVKDADLPLTATLLRNIKGEVGYVLFTYQDILLYVSDSMPNYNKENDKWECEAYNEETDEDETVNFNEYWMKVVDEDLSMVPGLPKSDRTVILLRKDHISDESLPYAEASERFLIYDKDNIAEALRRFIAEQ